MSTTSSGLESGLSILLITTIGFSPRFRDFLRTNLVWGIGPSKASTRRSTPSTIFKILSTSPPKSACPGVSTIFIFISLYRMDVFLARIVIPLSFSRSLESMTLSVIASFALNIPLCLSIPSTRVVLPWSTWAIMAMFLMSLRNCILCSPFVLILICSQTIKSIAACIIPLRVQAPSKLSITGKFCV